MKARPSVKRIGRYWIDRELIDEGYCPNDVFEDPLSITELPELMEPRRSEAVYWLRCPACEESTRVSRSTPICSHCGWNQKTRIDEPLKCAA